jgi:hypothetical protein
VADWPLPPYIEPRGPLGDDDEVVRAFARSELAPYSGRFHVEGPTLLANRDVPAAMRIGPRTILVRVDLPDNLLEVKPLIEGVLAAEGLTLLDTDTMLGVAVAVQRVGLRLSSWDLWGADIDEAFADLRTSAAGGEDDVLFGGGGPPLA